MSRYHQRLLQRCLCHKTRLHRYYISPKRHSPPQILWLRHWSTLRTVHSPLPPPPTRRRAADSAPSPAPTGNLSLFSCSFLPVCFLLHLKSFWGYPQNEPWGAPHGCIHIIYTTPPRAKQYTQRKKSKFLSFSPPCGPLPVRLHKYGPPPVSARFGQPPVTRA